MKISITQSWKYIIWTVCTRPRITNKTKIDLEVKKTICDILLKTKNRSLRKLESKITQ